MTRGRIVAIALAGAVAVVIVFSVTIINRRAGQPPNPVVHPPESVNSKELTTEQEAAEQEGARVLERSRARKPTTPIHGVFPTEEAATQNK
jgi:hypothetical protein